MKWAVVMAATAGAVLLALPAYAMDYTFVPGPIGSHVLQMGDRGPAVATLQGDLLQFGYDQLGRADGYFGPATRAALLAFQRDNQLPATGILDKATFLAILQEGGWSAPWTAGDGSAANEGGSNETSTSTGTVIPQGRVLTMVATAYGPSLQDNYPYGPVDAFGAPLKPGDVAVDPRVIPLGTRLYVTGYHSPYLPPGGFYAVARDTGGAIKGDRIDLFIDGTPAEVASFGIQRVEVTILGP